MERLEAGDRDRPEALGPVSGAADETIIDRSSILQCEMSLPAETQVETTAETPMEMPVEMLLLPLPERLKPLVDSLRSHELTPIFFSVPGAGIATGPHRGALSGSRH